MKAKTSRGARKARRADAWPKSPGIPAFPAMFFYAAADFAAASDAYVLTYGVSTSASMPTYLLAQSFELAVKAVLLADDTPERTVRGLGHDLTAAVALAHKRGLQVVDPEVDDSAWGIEALTEAYASKELVYQERGRWSGPALPLLRRLVHFAVHRAARHALKSQVRETVLSTTPMMPGLSLETIHHYE